MSCCPDVMYWCSPDGPVSASAVDGVYTRPDGATGHPYTTYDEAAGECPPPDLSATGADCCDDAPFTVPGLVFFTFANRTGTLADAFPNSVAVVLSDTSVAPDVTFAGSSLFYPEGGADAWAPAVSVSCPSEYESGDDAGVTVSVGYPSSLCSSPLPSVTPNAPWTDTTTNPLPTGNGFLYRSLACGGWPLSEPEFVGHWDFTCGADTISFDLWVSR